MKITKKIATFVLCLILTAIFAFSSAAESVPTISLSNVTALPGESVTIDIAISNNPGIMAMSFCITYNSDAFEYIGYSKGYLSKYTIKDHSDKGQIAFVNDETSNKSNNGVMMSVKFKVKDKAAPGKHTITIANQNREKHGNKLHNCFSNSDLKYIVPSVLAGSITVEETCENAGHKYGEWEIIAPADCKNTGEKKHLCVRCNEYSETVEIPITHDFEAEWTVDKAATPIEDGVMTRHCRLCEAVTDKITFTYKEVEDSQNPDDSTSSEDNTSTDTSSNETPSENNSSDNQSSENDGSSDTTDSNKTPINNTVGSKNPQSAVENIKDYQENIKPNLDKNSSSVIENTDSESNTVSSSADIETDADITSDSSESTDANDTSIGSSQTNLITAEIVLFILSGIISIAIIAIAVILIIRRKNK